MSRLIFTLLIALSAVGLQAAAIDESKNPQKNVSELKFETKIIGLVKECILYNDQLKDKESILELLNSVEKHSVYTETGSDDFRSKFVHTQAAFEHILACSQAMGDVVDLVGVIHTPTPTTPLCVTPDKKIPSSVLDETVRWDLDKLLTVQSRTQIVREFMLKGGRLYVAYPQGGFQKRALEQQGIYKQALAEFRKNLFDTVLRPNSLDPDMIGATYLFKNTRGQIFAFSIKARQANDAQEKSEWGIWFGPIEAMEVKKRTDQVFDYLKEIDGPDLRDPRYFK